MIIIRNVLNSWILQTMQTVSERQKHIKKEQNLIGQEGTEEQHSNGEFYQQS